MNVFELISFVWLQQFDIFFLERSYSKTTYKIITVPDDVVIVILNSHWVRIDCFTSKEFVLILILIDFENSTLTDTYVDIGDLSNIQILIFDW